MPFLYSSFSSASRPWPCLKACPHARSAQVCFRAQQGCWGRAPRPWPRLGAHRLSCPCRGEDREWRAGLGSASHGKVPGTTTGCWLTMLPTRESGTKAGRKKWEKSHLSKRKRAHQSHSVSLYLLFLSSPQEGQLQVLIRSHTCMQKWGRDYETHTRFYGYI